MKVDCAESTIPGGETPINNSILLYQRLKEQHPEFIDELGKKVVLMI